MRKVRRRIALSRNPEDQIGVIEGIGKTEKEAEHQADKIFDWLEQGIATNSRRRKNKKTKRRRNKARPKARVRRRRKVNRRPAKRRNVARRKSNTRKPKTQKDWKAWARKMQRARKAKARRR